MVILERHIRVMLRYAMEESGNVTAHHGTETKASDQAIIVVTALLFLIFVVGLFSVCFRWTSRQIYSEQSVNPFTDSDDESRTSITAARGLDEAIINSFPTFLYSEVKERKIGIGGVECAVCLCEFQDDETLRLMPNCCHVFHADCVSVWLSDHSTCPLCRVDLFSQPGERSELIPVMHPTLVESSNAQLFDGVSWTNRNREPRSLSTRLSQYRVSQILFSRSHSTGHSLVKQVDNLDRFKLRLPEEVRRQLTKKTLPQARSSRHGYRSKSAGSGENSVFSHQRNNHNNNQQLRSMSFSFSDCAWSTSGYENAVAPSKKLPINSGERPFHPDDLV